MKPLNILVRHLPTLEDDLGLLTPAGAHGKLLDPDSELLRRMVTPIKGLSDKTKRPITLWSSLSSHAKETATQIGENLNLEGYVHSDVRLNNIDQGILSGSTQLEFSKTPLYHRWHSIPNYVSFPTGESLDDVKNRIRSFICDSERTSNINVIVSHTTPLQVLMLEMLGMSCDHLWNVYFAYYAVSIIYGNTVLALNTTDDISYAVEQMRE